MVLVKAPPCGLVHANQQVVFVKAPLRGLHKASACKLVVLVKAPARGLRIASARKQVVIVKAPLRGLRKASACKRAGGISQGPTARPS